jgi:hypothetical protein
MSFDSRPATSFAAVLRHDLMRLASELGLAQLRVTVVDLPMLAFQQGWSMGAGGEFAPVAPSDRTPDTVFPGAAEALRGLVDAKPEHTTVRKLSPRRWVFGWRLDDLQIAVAELQYSDRRDAISDTDTNLMRALCTTLISSTSSGSTPAAAAPLLDDSQVWPQVDRRARVRPPVPTWVLPALLALCVVAAGWLSLAAAPAAQETVSAQQAELQRLRATAETTVAHGLAVALATGDYGEVQTTLAMYAEQGFFNNAAVMNDRQRVVAAVGSGERLRIGDPVTPEYVSQASGVDLKIGNDTLGRLLRADPNGSAAPASTGGARGAALAVLLAALGSLGVLGFSHWRQQRR